MYTFTNIDKARTLLGYKPKYSVKQGLEEVTDCYWEYFQSIID